MTNNPELTKYLFSLSPIERGNVFELYCRWFLENDPIYSAQLKKVWLWKDWPNNWGRDKGIDLIAETHTGELWAIQAKCYDENYYVTKEDVDKFLSESSRATISYRLLICTTDRLGDNAREVIAAQEKQVGICSLERLLDTSLNWPASVDNLQPSPIRKPKTPRPHQKNAIAAVLEGFKTYDKGQLHMACGTGKTLTGLWIAEALKSQNTLILVPSISLVSQLYQEWVANATTNFIPIFVCSDPTVGEKDQMVTSLYELGFPTTTDSRAILNYFSSTTGIPKVIFSTYHSSSAIGELCALDKNLTFDITIADEAHRCSGSANSDFATLFEPGAIRTHRKLFMTATPKIFSDHVKTKAQEVKYDILSMDDEEKFGPVFHKLPFSTAIAQDLLSDYEVLISIMDDKTYRDYAEKGRFVAIHRHESDARTIASQLLVSKAIKSYDLKRIITFHNRKSAADEFIHSFPIALNLVAEEERPTIGFYGLILGDMLQSRRQSILKLFENIKTGSSAVLANVRCLSEGVDVPTLDGVAFIDPKGSETEIIQAVGRAIRKAPNKKKGLIILPVFIDANDDPEINLDDSCFKPIWKVLKALRSHDDILAEELDHLRLELGKRTFRKPPKLGKITIDLPVSIDATFSNSLRLKILENTSASWFYYFGLLEKFREENGHCNVPDDYPENTSFGHWVQNQRSKKSGLSKERIQMLDELGFDWDPRDSAWNLSYMNLIKFKEDNGHCNVPVDYSVDPFLGRWINTQRTKKNELSENRIHQLNLINFDWDRSESAWNEMYAKLVKFKEISGHCNVPKDYPESPKLGLWVSTQRLKTTKKTPIRIEKLNELGFCWNTLDASWNHYFDKLIQFKKHNGHCNVPIDYEEDPSFASWISRQRTKKARLPKERITKLDELGFDWDPRESDWNQQYALLVEFHAQNGHCNVSKNHPQYSSLAGWVQTQRMKNSELSNERKHKLNQIGFNLDPLYTTWKINYDKIVTFKKANDHCNVPARYKQDPQLGTWVANLRQKKNTLPIEWIEKLDRIGFVWDPFDTQWDNNFTKLVKFKENYGNCNVPLHYPQDPSLGRWVNTQRTKKNELSAGRIHKLNLMGFDWDPLDKTWKVNYERLVTFKEANGHCNVPARYKQDPQLGIWVAYQRQKKNTLPVERIEKLDRIGFVWDPFDTLWDNNFTKLVKFKENYGNCNVPVHYTQDPSLGRWVNIQRTKKNELSADRIHKLNLMGFDWDPREST